MKIGVLGSGMVGQTLAAGFAAHGNDVRLATRSPEKMKEWAEKNPSIPVETPATVGTWAEVVVLAVKGTAAAEALRGAGDLNGKVVIDATNPIEEAPPEQGVLKYFTTLNHSLMEDLQKEFPGARFVKAFNSVGAGLMIDPQLPGGPPTMFLCGNDEAAKTLVSGLLESVGWQGEDMGGAEAARAIEPLAMLWCIPGFQRNEWAHAFKLLRA